MILNNRKKKEPNKDNFTDNKENLEKIKDKVFKIF